MQYISFLFIQKHAIFIQKAVENNAKTIAEIFAEKYRWFELEVPEENVRQNLNWMLLTLKKCRHMPDSAKSENVKKKKKESCLLSNCSFCRASIDHMDDTNFN